MSFFESRAGELKRDRRAQIAVGWVEKKWGDFAFRAEGVKEEEAEQRERGRDQGWVYCTIVGRTEKGK